MIYSNYEFLIFFLPIVFWFYALRSVAAQNLLLLVTSAIFLAWTNVWNLLPALIVLVVGYRWFVLEARYHLNWHAAGLMIAALVCQLIYFKYRGFLADTFGLELPIPSALAFLIPLGISFYTFEAISAIVDIKRRHLPVPAMNWSLFVMFFPHLIAGPIVRWRQLAHQFNDAKKLRWRNIAIGLHFFTIGFLKKLGADPLGAIIDPVWRAPDHANWAALLLALVGFYAQLYLDFSGYTDMGRGIARILGFRLPLNFRAPFFAHSPTEFYQRWHVSLSSWIRIFVYDTLAVAVFRRVHGRQRQNWALFGVILLVMAIFGIWHGSAWHFVMFGVAQGFVISGWSAVTKGRVPRSYVGWLTSLLLLQLSWLISLVFFRSEGLPAVGQFLVGLTRQAPMSDPALLWCLVALAATLVVQAPDYYVRYRPVARVLRVLRGTTVGACIVCVVFIFALAFKISLDAQRIAAPGAAQPQGFIYFRF